MGSPFPGPTPIYSNPPIQPQNFAPSRFVISNIILGLMTIVTTAVVMNYVVGQLVRLIIPKGYGCVQLNEVDGYVIEILSDDQIILDIDTSLPIFNEFIPFNGRTPPEIVAVGDINTGIISSTGRIIAKTNVPGAFINIS